jgi:hypothetical protein
LDIRHIIHSKAVTRVPHWLSDCPTSLRRVGFPNLEK